MRILEIKIILIFLINFNFNLFNKFQAHLKTSTEESKLNYYSLLSSKLLDSKSELVLVNIKDFSK